MSHSSLDAVFDVDRLNSVFRSELSEYLNSLPEYNLSEESENCGALIAWLCVFAPETITDESKSKLHEVCYELTARPTYKLVGWFQELPLKLALYGIYREHAYLRSHIENLSYGGSGLRCYIMDSLALVAPEVDIRDEILRWAAGRNLEIVHMACE